MFHREEDMSIVRSRVCREVVKACTHMLEHPPLVPKPPTEVVPEETPTESETTTSTTTTDTATETAPDHVPINPPVHVEL